MLGHGGIRIVALAAGVREATVSLGVSELDSGADLLGRARKPGGGRKRLADLDPGLRPALLALVEPDERGIRCRRCGGRRSRCARSRPSSPARATARARTRWRICCTRRASACRAMPRPWRGSRARTGTPSSVTLMSRPESTRTPGNRSSAWTPRRKSWSAIITMAAVSGGRRVTPSGSMTTTSPTRGWARPSRTGSTTWPRTPAG